MCQAKGDDIPDGYVLCSRMTCSSYGGDNDQNFAYCQQFGVPAAPVSAAESGESRAVPSVDEGALFRRRSRFEAEGMTRSSSFPRHKKMASELDVFVRRPSVR